MEDQGLRDMVFRTAADLSVLRQSVADLEAKEKKAEEARKDLRHRLLNVLQTFHRDRYKATEQRLLIGGLAQEIVIYERLGYDIGVPGALFIVGVGNLLVDRNQAAVECFHTFIQQADPDDPNLPNAHYLTGMISYNRRDFNRAIAAFRTTFESSPADRRDWQSAIYVAELLFLARRPQDTIEKAFLDIEEELKAASDGGTTFNSLLAMLYLKFGNCYVETSLDPKQRNPMVNNAVAIGHYKRARKLCPRLADSESLLAPVIDYSLAQALLLAGSVDMDLAQTPTALLQDIFQRLRRVVLSKREEIILAQTYFMMATCTHFVPDIGRDIGQIYLEYARHQTLTVPAEVCFYSCITKELLSRDDFVRQIDFYAGLLERQPRRR